MNNNQEIIEIYTSKFITEDILTLKLAYQWRNHFFKIALACVAISSIIDYSKVQASFLKVVQFGFNLTGTITFLGELGGELIINKKVKNIASKTQFLQDNLELIN